MADEPPAKLRKKGGRNWKSESILESHGITTSLESTSSINEISNELLLAMTPIETPLSFVYNSVRKLFGLKEETTSSNSYRRFTRLVDQLRKQRKALRRRTEDRFAFYELVALNADFFNEESTDGCSTTTKVLTKTHPESTEQPHINSSSKETVPIGMNSETEPLFLVDSADSYVVSDQNINHGSGTLRYENLKKRYKNLQKTVNTLKHWKGYHQNLIKSKLPKNSKKVLRYSYVLKLWRSQKSVLDSTKRSLREQEELCHFLQFQLSNSSKIIDLKDGKNFSAATFLAVISLKSQGVADSKVGEVIKIVGKLIGVTFKDLPSGATCRRFSISTLHLAQTHVKEMLEESIRNGKPLCLASDETTKGTTKLQAFGLHDSSGSFLCLGIEQVVDKSADTAFEVFMNSVSNLPNGGSDFFKKFILNVKSTISDSARTEIKFNSILQNFKKSVLPETMENFDKLTPEEQEHVSEISNFFCQLHIISNFTKVVLKCLLEHEIATNGTTKQDEPTVFVLIKLVGQLFGQSGSGMHQILTMWEPWCQEQKITRFTFESFVGNRFNHLFVLASRIFFHRQHLITFCENTGRIKPELQRVQNMLQSSLISSHLQVLGFCDQLITGPLWRLSENSEHILSTCEYALQLQKWLEECKEFPNSFFDGISPVPNLQTYSQTTSPQLLQELSDTVPTEAGLEAAALVATSSLEFFRTMYADFLPGGQNCTDSDQLKEATVGAPATNQKVESVFGVISHLFETKPNMRLDTRIASTMIKTNHTLTWLESLPEDEQDVILKESRAALNRLDSDYKSKREHIFQAILQQMRQRNSAATQRCLKKSSAQRTCVQEIIPFGLWLDKEDISEGLEKIDSEASKREAVIIQLRFRQRLLKQLPPVPKAFNVTVDQKPVPLAVLKMNLQLLTEKEVPAQGGIAHHDDIVGKNFIHLFTTSNGPAAIRSGTVVDIKTDRRGQKGVLITYDDDKKSHRFSMESFQDTVARKQIILH